MASLLKSATSFFKKPDRNGVAVTDNGVKVGLYNEQAVSGLINMLTKMPDTDEVLRSAGITRHRLRVLLTDDEISQSTETRLDALLSVPMRLEPAAGGNEQFGLFLQTEITKHFESIVTGAWMSLLFGYSVMEAVYLPPIVNGALDPYDKYVRLATLGEKPMEWFEPRSDGALIYRPRMGVFALANDPFARPTENGDGYYVDQRFKFFCTRRKATYQQPYGEALLSRLYWPWFFRQNGWRFWGKFLERFGQPMLVANTIGDTTKMLVALLSAHSQAAMAIGKDDKVVALEAQGKGEAFDLFETALLRRIQKLVLGGTLTSGTDGGSGNRALGDVHDQVRQDKKISDIRLVVPTMQRIVDALSMVNGQAPGSYTIWMADEQGLSKDRADRDKLLYAMGVRWTPDYLQNNYELRPEDFTITTAPEVDPETGLPIEENDEAVPPPKKKSNKVDAQASRSARQFVRHKAASRFTKGQQMVEDLVDDAQSQGLQPLQMDAVRSAVAAATSPEDLEERLFALVGDHDDFQQLLERCLFAGDILGYVHASGKV